MDIIMQTKILIFSKLNFLASLTNIYAKTF